MNWRNLNPRSNQTPYELFNSLWRWIFPRNHKRAAANAIAIAVSGGLIDEVDENGKQKSAKQLWSEMVTIMIGGTTLLDWLNRTRAPTWEWLVGIAPEAADLPKDEVFHYNCELDSLKVVVWKAVKDRKNGGARQ